MKTRCVVSLMVLAAFMLISQPALADDLADLKATHMGWLKAVNTGDVETMVNFWQEGGVFMPASRPFPIVVNKERAKKIWTRVFQTHMLILTMYKLDYRVIGNTGLVWGHFEELMMNKEKRKGIRRPRKFLMTYLKSEGKWQIVGFAACPILGEQKVF